MPGYKWTVGVRPLSSEQIQAFCQGATKYAAELGRGPNAKVSHAALLLGDQIFEYGVNGWERNLADSKKKKEFDWNYLGTDLYGVTQVSPDQLQQIIEADGTWNGVFSLHPYTPTGHNCHKFVMFCLNHMGKGADHFFKNYDCALMKIFKKNTPRPWSVSP